MGDNEQRGYTETEWRQMIQNDEVRMYPDMAEKFKAMQDRAEWQQLKDAVVEATKAEMRDNPFLQATSSTAFVGALADLFVFEKERGLK